MAFAKEKGWIHQDMADILAAEERQIIKEMRNKQFKLDKLNGKEVADGRLTDEEIVAAKSVPIETYYTGKLRKSGNKLVGRCPFHEEKSGSFFIYKNNLTNLNSSNVYPFPNIFITGMSGLLPPSCMPTLLNAATIF